MKESQMSRYGAIARALPFTFGKIFFVVNSSDAVTAELVNEFPRDKDGVDRVYTSLSAAYDACTSENNNVIVLDGNSTHTLATMLTVAKNRVHFVGLDYLLGDKRKYGQSSKITVTTGNFVILNTGVRNSFSGIKFMTDYASSKGAVGEGGEYAVYRNCEFYNSTQLDSDTVAELVLGGDSAQFYDCTVGSLADAVSGNKVRPAVLVDGSEVAGGAGTSRDILFDRCHFWKKAGGVLTVMIKVAADADLERIMEIHDCQFVANKLGSVPTEAVGLGAALTASQILLTGDTCASNCAKIAVNTRVGIINCTPARVATTTIGIQAT